MLISGTSLLSGACKLSRHSFDGTAALAEKAIEVSYVMRERGTLLVDMPVEWCAAVTPLLRNRSTLKEYDPATADRGVLSLQNETMFLTLQQGLITVRRLWATQRINAVRALGYGMHHLPGLLWSPEQFDRREWYAFCFPIICSAWDELPGAFKIPLCALVGLEVEQAAMLVREPGFVTPWG